MKIDVIKFTDEKLRRVIIDSFCFYERIKGNDLQALKKTDFMGIHEYMTVSPVEKKVMALFLALLNTENIISDTLGKRGIYKKNVLDYLGYDDLSVKESDFRRIEMQFEMLNFVDYLNVKGEELSIELLAHLLFSSSDIIEHFFYSEISKSPKVYEGERLRIKELYEHKISVKNSIFKSIVTKYNLLGK